MSKILEAEQEAKWQSMVQCEEHEQRIQFLENHVRIHADFLKVLWQDLVLR